MSILPGVLGTLWAKAPVNAWCRLSETTYDMAPQMS